MCSFLYNHVGTLVNAWLIEEKHRQCEASPALRTTYRRKSTTFPRSWDGKATQVASSALPLGHLNMRRMPRTHCQMKGAVPSWWCCHTQQVSARTSGGVQKVQHESHLQVRTVTPLSADLGEGPSTNGEAVQGCVMNLLQLQRGLHWWDQKKVGDKVEGAPRSLEERDIGEVCSSWTCMERPCNTPIGGIAIYMYVYLMPFSSY